MAKFDWNALPAVENAPKKPGKFSWDSMPEAEPEEVSAPKKADSTSAGMAALEHFGNAASLGYLPQLQAAVSQLMPNPGAEVDAKLRAQGFNVPNSKPSYVSERDANIKRLETQAEEHPYAAGAGTVGGALTTGIAAGAAVPIKAATSVGRMALAAGSGGALGLLANPGDTEGEISVVQPGERMWGAATGAAMGAAGQGLIEGASKVAKGVMNLPSSLKAKAEERAFKASGAMLKDYRVAGKRGRINELGRYMLDNGLIKPGATVDDIAAAAEKLHGKHGEAIGEILQKLDDAGAVAPSHDSIAKAIESQARPMKGMSTARPTYKAMQNVADDIRKLGKEPATGISRGQVSSLTGRGTEYLVDPVTGDVMAQFRNGKMVNASGSTLSPELAQAATVATPTNITPGEIPGTFQGAQEAKKFIEEQVKAAGGWKALAPTEKNLALRKTYSLVSDMIEGSADQGARGMGDAELLKSYVSNKAGFGNAKELGGIATDQALRQNANRFFSPSDYFSGATGAIVGAASGDDVEGKLKGAALGAGLGLINKAGRKYGTPLVSLGLDKAGKLLSRTPLPALGELSAPVLRAVERSPLAVANVARKLGRPNFERVAETLPKVADEDQKPKGEERWARAGLEKLGIQDRGIASQLMQSKEGKRLLIEASDLPPNSKAMQRIREQIKKGLGK